MTPTWTVSHIRRRQRLRACSTACCQSSVVARPARIMTIKGRCAALTIPTCTWHGSSGMGVFALVADILLSEQRCSSANTRYSPVTTPTWTVSHLRRRQRLRASSTACCQQRRSSAGSQLAVQGRCAAPSRLQRRSSTRHQGLGHASRCLLPEQRGSSARTRHDCPESPRNPVTTPA